MSTRRSNLLLIVFGVLVAAITGQARVAQPPAAAPADLVLTNGRIVTVEDAVPEAQAIAIKGSRIAAIGGVDAIKPYIGSTTRVIDLDGQLAIPGFIESHGHFTGIGETNMELDLTTARSWDDIVAMVADAVRKAGPGEWIYGRGWHQEKWTARPQPNVEGFPTHASLDKVSPDNPVVLEHASGHASFVNAKAMAASGIRRSTESPAGGDVLRDSSGDATGLLRETAQRLVKEPQLSLAERTAHLRKVLELANQEVLSKGITTFVDAGSPLEVVDGIRTAVDEGAVGVRMWVMIRQPNAAFATKLKQYRTIDHADGHFTVRALKKVMDGALGSRGAWMLEPYSDKPGWTGFNTTSLAEIREAARLAIANGYQLCVHAIGDRANRETLDIFEQAFKANPGSKDLRWRVEHAQHLDAQDIPRFGRLGVIASMQGIHCTSDAPYVITRLGAARAEEGAYVWQKLMKSGAVIANGTDAPVEDVNPIPNFYASVTRKTKDGTAFYPDQRMTRMEALKSYTIDGAYAAFEEANRGSLSVGKYADVTVLSKDIMTVPDDEIRSAKVVYTIVGGKVLYEAPRSARPDGAP